MYRVTWQRRGWVHESSRTFDAAHAMRRFVDKLLAGGRPDLEPLVLLVVDERPVGPWVRSAEVIPG
jgi:hypothetical protein